MPDERVMWLALIALGTLAVWYNSGGGRGFFGARGYTSTAYAYTYTGGSYSAHYLGAPPGRNLALTVLARTDLLHQPPTVTLLLP
jgi:hypothetical protein